MTLISEIEPMAWKTDNDPSNAELSMKPWGEGTLLQEVGHRHHVQKRRALGETNPDTVFGTSPRFDPVNGKSNLLQLPAEIRLQIYKHVFTGATAMMLSTPASRVGHKQRVYHCRATDPLRRGGALLLASRRIYLEAVGVYCASTNFVFNRMYDPISPPRIVETWLSYDGCGVQNVRKIQYVVHMTRQHLEEFPRTCEMFAILPRLEELAINAMSRPAPRKRRILLCSRRELHRTEDEFNAEVEDELRDTISKVRNVKCVQLAVFWDRPQTPLFNGQILPDAVTMFRHTRGKLVAGTLPTPCTLIREDAQGKKLSTSSCPYCEIYYLPWRVYSPDEPGFKMNNGVVRPDGKNDIGALAISCTKQVG